MYIKQIQENCPYCHSDTMLLSPTMEKIDVPSKYLWQFLKEKDNFMFNLYILDKKLWFEESDRDGEYANYVKINYCPMCGRKLKGESDDN